MDASTIKRAHNSMMLEAFITIAETLAGAVCLVDEHGRILSANPAMLRFLAIPPGCVDNRTIYDLSQPDQHNRLRQYLKNFSRSRQSGPGRLDVVMPDGHTKRCLLRGNLLQPRRGGEPALIMLRTQNRKTDTSGFITLNEKIGQLQREVAERRKVEEALRKSERQVRLLLDSTGEAIYGLDVNGNCTFANPACVQMLGYDSEDELLEENMHMLTHHTRPDGSPCPVEESRIYHAHTLGKKVRADDSVFWRKDGSSFPVEYHAYPISPDGETIGSVVTFNDITERKSAEEQIRRLNEELELRVEVRTAELQVANHKLQTSLEQLNNAQDQLVQSEKMAALGGLVAGVAHEINTPVGIGVTAASHLEQKVKRYTSLYEQGSLTREHFESLLKAVDEATCLILNNLGRAAELVRSFKQVAVDQSSGEARVFSLKTYLDEVLQSLHPELKKTPHQVTVTCSGTLELFSYPGALAQVVTNLVMNSLIHGFDNMDRGEIAIDVSETDEGVVLLYRDNGKGIAADKVKMIFDPFYTTKRNQGGSGLGMHIVYNLVTQTLGGQIHCNSEPGQGVYFQINVPHGETKQRIAAL